MAVQRLTHIGICVSDLERSVAFYRDVLGCREVGRLETDGPEPEAVTGVAGVKLVAVYLERDGVRIELLYYASPGHVGPDEARPMNQLGLTHFSFRVDDLEATCAQVQSAGGKILTESHVTTHGASTQVVFALDPDGTRLELVQAPGDPWALPQPPS